MHLSQKCYYALRALYELARNPSTSSRTIASIGTAQGIPIKFLQVILRELRQGGFVESRRGRDGGYSLAKPPRSITMGDVIRFVDGEMAPTECASDPGQCAANRECPFLGIWQDAATRINAYFDNITIEDIVERGRRMELNNASDFVI